MDDLQLLRTLLSAPGPSPDAAERGRRRLQEAIRRPGRRRIRIGWLAAGSGLAAAAGAAAVVAAFGPMAPSARPGSRPPAARLSGQQVLLAAASTAERGPAASGTYWHVLTRLSDRPSDQWQAWTRRDGETWTAKATGPAVRMPGRSPFMLAGAALTFTQLQHLPAAPATLHAWIVRNAAAHGGKGGSYGQQAPSRAREREAVFDSLTALVSDLPVPPGLRAAAFRVMASFPGVTSLGPVRGGQSLLFSLTGNQQARLVVDPATSRVSDTNFLVTGGDAEIWIRSPVTATVTAGWTNHLPGSSTARSPTR